MSQSRLLWIGESKIPIRTNRQTDLVMHSVINYYDSPSPRILYYAGKLFLDCGAFTARQQGIELQRDKVVRIQEAVPDVELVVDANQGYKPKEAVAFAREIYKEGVKVKLFEQPVLKWDIEGLRFVRYNCPYPVAADESVFTRYDAYRLVKEDCVDYINIKLMKSGLLDALAIVEIAKSANVKLMIGCMGETSLGISQSAHFAGGLGAFSHHDLDSHLLIKEKEFRGRFKQEGPILKLY